MALQVRAFHVYPPRQTSSTQARSKAMLDTHAEFIEIAPVDATKLSSVLTQPHTSRQPLNCKSNYSRRSHDKVWYTSALDLRKVWSAGCVWHSRADVCKLAHDVSFDQEPQKQSWIYMVFYLHYCSDEGQLLIE